MKSCNRGFIGHITQMDHLVTRPKSKPKLLRQYLKYYNIYGNIYHVPIIVQKMSKRIIDEFFQSHVIYLSKGFNYGCCV